MGVIFHCHISWISFFSYQHDVLNFLLRTDKYCAHAGGLFNFRKDQGFRKDPIQLQERPPKARVPAPIVSEDEDRAELIIPDCQDGSSGAGDI
jgi:hypothetical protein